MFEKHRLEKEAKEHAVALAAWQDEDDTLRGTLDTILHRNGPADVAMVLKAGEQAVLQAVGAGLFEPRRGAGHYEGASQGVSIPIGNTGVRYRIGKSRGTFIPGDESPTIIDTGTVVITDQRVVFMGTKRTVEWAFSKLIAIQHYQNRPWTAIQVSNRQKVTGLVYDTAHQHLLRLSLEAALALFNHDTAELQDQLTQAITAHDAARPYQPEAVASAPAPAPAIPMSEPGWFHDPADRHEYRFWDGRRWTDAVADGGVERSDPP